MGHQPESGEGVLVVSVWHEQTDDVRFRARLSAVDAGGTTRAIGVATTHEDALRLVGDWITSVSASQPADPPEPDSPSI